jgi:nitrous oxide reductase accessory protein NosL
MISRRTLLSALVIVPLVACKKEQRCPNCGMKLDPSSGWRADLVVAGQPVSYDTPRCAFTAWRSGAAPATAIRIQDFYDRAWKDGADVRFVAGSDVNGPMGADLVPVDAARAERFTKDHGGRALTLAEVTLDVAKDPK